MSKSQSRPGKIIGIYADVDLDERLTRMAEKAKLSKSQLAKNFLEVALDQMESLDRIGLLGLTVFFRDFKENFSKAAQETKRQVMGNGEA